MGVHPADFIPRCQAADRQNPQLIAPTAAGINTLARRVKGLPERDNNKLLSPRGQQSNAVGQEPAFNDIVSASVSMILTDSMEGPDGVAVQNFDGVFTQVQQIDELLQQCATAWGSDSLDKVRGRARLRGRS